MNVHLTQGSRSVCNGVETSFPVRQDDLPVTHSDAAGRASRPGVALGHYPAGVIKLLGVPAFAWAALCLALAVLWLFVWPSGQATGTAGFTYLALRWAHSVTWLVLAVAAAAAALGFPVAAQRVAMAALPAYAAFLYATVTSG
jgi:hypothetical protein